VEGAYSGELKSGSESCTVELSELSEVSVPAPSRSHTVFGSIPSFFMRVMKVVRLSPRRASLNTHRVEEPRPFLAISQPWVCARIAEARFAPTAVWNAAGTHSAISAMTTTWASHA
jgi:hypothetical protein